MAEKSRLPTKDFWKLLKIYYMCDAGSYTVDAGGRQSLDRLFSFDPKKGEMDFAPEIKFKIDSLGKEIY